MLRKYDETLGRYTTSAGEVITTRESAQARIRARASTGTLSQAYIRAGELEAGSCELGLYAHEDELENEKEEKDMFYVVDQWDQYIREFNTRDEADAFCEKWNSKFRFSEWTAPKAHVIEAE
jgi:hypothetical protein